MMELWGATKVRYACTSLVLATAVLLPAGQPGTAPGSLY
jgi:hypothetical protein